MYGFTRRGETTADKQLQPIVLPLFRSMNRTVAKYIWRTILFFIWPAKCKLHGL